MRSDAHGASTPITFDQNVVPSSAAARAATGAQNITSPGWTPRKSTGQRGNLEGGRRLAEVDARDEKKRKKKVSPMRFIGLGLGERREKAYTMKEVRASACSECLECRV